jgi:hypothetical protein
MSFRLGSATFVGRRGVERRATVRISVVDVTGAAKRKDVPGWLAFLVAMGGELSRDFFKDQAFAVFWPCGKAHKSTSDRITRYLGVFLLVSTKQW